MFAVRIKKIFIWKITKWIREKSTNFYANFSDLAIFCFRKFWNFLVNLRDPRNPRVTPNYQGYKNRRLLKFLFQPISIFITVFEVSVEIIELVSLKFQTSRSLVMSKLILLFLRNASSLSLWMTSQPLEYSRIRYENDVYSDDIILLKVSNIGVVSVLINNSSLESITR